MREFNLVSFFGGFEQGAASLTTLGIVPTRYFSSEVDPYAIKTSWHNFPWITHIGSVTDVDYGDGILAWKEGGQNKFEFVRVDALIGWPPCTNLSVAGNQEGLGASTREEYAAIKKQYHDIKNGITVITDENREECTEIVEFFEKTQSHLFWEFVRFFDQAQPEYVFVENVKSMKKEAKEIISRALGFEPIMIDAALVSGQRRQRLYWKARRNADGTYTSVDVPQPADRGIKLRDVLEHIPFDAVNAKGDPVWRPLPEKYLQIVTERMKAFTITAGYQKAWPACHVKCTRTVVVANVNPSGKGMNGNVYADVGLAPTLTTNKGEWNKILGVLGIPRGNNEGSLSTEKTHAVTCSKWEGNNLLVAAMGIWESEKAHAVVSSWPATHPTDYFDRNARDIVVGVIHAEPYCLNPQVDGEQPSLADRAYHPDGKATEVTTSFITNVVGVIPANGVNRYFDEAGNRTKSKEGSVTREFQVTPFEDPDKSGTLTTFEKDNLLVAKVVIPEATAKGYVEVEDGDCVDMGQPNSKTRRGRLMSEKSNALTTSNEFMHVRKVPEEITEDRYEYQYYWRKLTVRECARLQGFPEWYQFPVSDSRAYKGIGNSWQRDVIDHIFTYLFHDLVLEKLASLEQEAQDLEIEARGQGVEGVLGVH